MHVVSYTTCMAKKYKIEPTWHVALAVLVAILLQLSLSSVLTLSRKYLMAGLEVILLVGLFTTRPQDELKAGRSQSLRRIASILLIAIIAVTNITSLVLVVHYLLISHSTVIGRDLIVSALAIYATNIIMFGLLYWELDGGGPGGRGNHRPPIEDRKSVV